AKQRSADLAEQVRRSREKVDRNVENAYQNGEITEDEYKTYKETGVLPHGFYLELNKSGYKFAKPTGETITASKKCVGDVPKIVMGDVKSLDSYYAAIHHLSEMEGRGKYNAAGNVGLALYDPSTGDVYLQVFGPRAKGKDREVIFECIIGHVDIP